MQYNWTMLLKLHDEAHGLLVGELNLEAPVNFSSWFTCFAQCGVFTKNMTIQAQSFSMSHMLITGTIDQMTNVPLYYTTDSESYNRIAVDVVQISDKNYTVLNLYSGNDAKGWLFT